MPVSTYYSAGAYNVANNTSVISLAMPSSLQAGSLLVAVVYKDTSSNHTYTSSWTKVTEVGSGVTASISIAYKWCNSAETAVVCSFNAAGGANQLGHGRVRQFLNVVSDANPLGGILARITSANFVATNSVQQTSTLDLLVSLVGKGINATFGTPASWSLVDSASSATGGGGLMAGFTAAGNSGTFYNPASVSQTGADRGVFSFRLRGAPDALVNTGFLSDTLVFNDSFSDPIYRMRTHTESLYLGDSTTLVRMTTRQQDDPLVFDDVAGTIRMTTRQQSDALAFGDSFSDPIYRNVTRTDTLTPYSDNSLREYTATMGDSLALLDDFIKSVIAAGGNVITRNQADGVLLTDAAHRTLVLNRTQIDALLASDGSSKALARSVLTSDGLTLLDALLASRIRGTVASDGTVLVDASHLSRTRGRVVSDAFEALDSTVRSRVLGRVLADNILPVSDAYSPARLLVRALGDTLTLTDNAIKQIVSAGANYVLVKDDALVVGDGVQKFVLSRRLLSDGVPLAYDEALDFLTRNRIAGDAFYVVDATGLARLRTTVLGDALAALVDAALTARRLTRQQDDLMVLTDNAIKQLISSGAVYAYVKDDFIVASDGTQRFLLLRRLLSESLTTTDSTLGGKATTLLRTLGDAIVLTDLSHLSRARGSVLGDAIVQLVDAALQGRVRGRLQSDALSPSDGRLATFARALGVVDGLTLADGIMQMRLRARTLLDLLSPSDAVNALYISGLSFTYDVRVRLSAVLPALLGTSMDAMPRILAEITRWIGQALDTPRVGAYPATATLGGY